MLDADHAGRMDLDPLTITHQFDLDLDMPTNGKDPLTSAANGQGSTDPSDPGSLMMADHKAGTEEEGPTDRKPTEREAAFAASNSETELIESFSDSGVPSDGQSGMTINTSSINSSESNASVGNREMTINATSINSSSSAVKMEQDLAPLIVAPTEFRKQQYQCRQCPSVFSSRWNCISHMRAHRRMRPVLECLTCGKKCIKRSELEIHARIHTGDKPFPCSICQRRFLRKGQLNSHMRSHSAEKSFLCCDCGAAFVNASNLKRHHQLHAKSETKAACYAYTRFVGNEARCESGQGGNLTTHGSRSLLVEGNVDVSNLVSFLEAPSSKPDCGEEAMEEVSFQGSLKANLDGCTMDASDHSMSLYEQIENFKAENSALYLSQHTTQESIPAISTTGPLPSQQLIIINPCGEEVEEGKVVEILDGAAMMGDVGARDGTSVSGELGGGWLTGVTAEGQGAGMTSEDTNPPPSGLETSNEALTSLMQVDWSFLLEDSSPPAPEQSIGELVETLTDESSPQPPLTDHASTPLQPCQVLQPFLPGQQQPSSNEPEQQAPLPPRPLSVESSLLLQSSSASATAPPQPLPLPHTPLPLFQTPLTLGCCSDPTVVSGVYPPGGDTVQSDVIVSRSVPLSVSGFLDGSYDVSLRRLPAPSGLVVPPVAGESTPPAAAVVPDVPGVPSVTASSVREVSGQLVSMEPCQDPAQVLEMEQFPGVGQVLGRFQDKGQLVGCLQDTGQLVGRLQDMGQLGGCLQDTGQLVGSLQDTGQLVGHLQDTGQLVGRLQDTGQLVGHLQDTEQLVGSLQNTEQLGRSLQDIGQLVGRLQDTGQLVGHFQDIGQATEQFQDTEPVMENFQSTGQMTEHFQDNFQDSGETSELSMDTAPVSENFQDTGQLTDSLHDQGHVGESLQDMGQLMEVGDPGEEENRGAEGIPIIIILEHPYGIQHFQNLIQGITGGAEEDLPVLLENVTFPSSHDPTALLQTSAVGEDGAMTMTSTTTSTLAPDIAIHGHDYISTDQPPPPAHPAQKKKTEKLLACDLCPKRFSRQCYLTAHRKAHLRDRTFTCEVCQASFSRVGNLNRHRLFHTGEKPFHCPQCPAKFANRYRLTEHERRHLGLKLYRCDVCHNNFGDLSSLRRHEKTHKGDNLQFTCDICGASFRTMHSLTSHLKVHNKEEGFGVTVSEVDFTAADVPVVTFDPEETSLSGTTTMPPSILKIKKKTAAATSTTTGRGKKEGGHHHEFLCSICHKSFPFSAACRQHIFSHLGSRPFRCADCGATFSRQACARRHTHMHRRRQKRHHCGQCGQRFQTRTKLLLHGDAHLPSDSLTVPCDACGERFSHVRLVAAHKSVFHRQVLCLYKPGVGIVDRDREGGGKEKKEKKRGEGSRTEMGGVEDGEGEDDGGEEEEGEENFEKGGGWRKGRGGGGEPDSEEDDKKDRDSREGGEARREKLVVLWKKPTLPEKQQRWQQQQQQQQQQRQQQQQNLDPAQANSNHHSSESPAERLARIGKKKRYFSKPGKGASASFKHAADVNTVDKTEKPSSRPAESQMDAETERESIERESDTAILEAENDSGPAQSGCERSPSRSAIPQPASPSSSNTEPGGFTRLRREAARNQKQFLASLHLKRKLRR